MKIAILGSRGTPANYGGFETLSEEISTRLVSRGHDVTVYCCNLYSKIDQKIYRGVRRIVIPAIKSKNLEKFVYALLSLLHVSFTKADIVLMLGVSVAVFCFIPRLFGKKVVINIDGLEWQRKKWGKIVSRYLRSSERIAGITANLIITDAQWVQKYYKKQYGKKSTYIAYGTEIFSYPPGETLEKLGLKPKEYMLYVSRFDPENNPLLVRKVFDEIERPEKKLVMVGDAPFADKYIQKVKDTHNPNIIFTGYQFGDAYRELQSNAYCYIHGHEVGGTNPALLEAMGAGNCVLANDVPVHREILEEAGVYYKDREDLKTRMIFLMQNVALVKEKGKAARKIAEKEYSWDSVVNEYETLFYRLVNE